MDRDGRGRSLGRVLQLTQSYAIAMRRVGPRLTSAMRHALNAELLHMEHVTAALDIACAAPTRPWTTSPATPSCWSGIAVSLRVRPIPTAVQTGSADARRAFRTPPVSS